MNIAFYTLGCKVNQYETQALGTLLENKGHKVVDDISVADVIVINTCTVTSSSDQKSRRAIRHFIKTNPNAKIAVCGCLSQVNTKSIEEINGVSVIAGTSDRESFVEAIDALTKHKPSHIEIDNPLSRREFEFLPAGGLLGHTRALLKIEDGCSNFCTYCIIPYSRGPVRSMHPETAVEECRKLSDDGFKEIVLTGIEISSYGRDLTPKTDLSGLIATLCEKFPQIRFRLGSLEPRTVTEEFCVKLKSFTNLCPHFHLSMQSGCDETLLRMKRKYDTARFFESVTLLKKHFNGAAITTDMIVGFPGEDENEFMTSLDFIQKCAFSSMHIFPYSIRRGT
ncbi:MAG: tRNA (N(6)-L-threonylcarbamoyladenosine(37)-C(2))-methylthiotransferase MtaB, partial [Oscillospiraceae bacterium]|nr:tRNA (N(6)-L-threonylcarbamoyladenosine(37)-C(2))-methylthiotransferase MtaB [Oscillospiraceae bacterium]